MLLLLLAASLPVLLEHFVFYDTFIGTMTHTSQTPAAKIGSPAPALQPLLKKPLPPPRKAGVGKDKKLDLLNKLELAKLDVDAQRLAKWKHREYGGIPYPVLSRRISTVRADGMGLFGQHPQFSNHWFEVYGGDASYGNKVYGYTEAEIVKEGEEYILEDKSTPRREKVFLRVVVGKVQVCTKFVRKFLFSIERLAQVVEKGVSKTGPWQTYATLETCDRIDGCVFVANYDRPGRKVHKFKGGAMSEIADGQVWAESNVDNGPDLFWFGFVHEDKKRVIGW